MGQIEKFFILVWMIVGNVLLPQVFKFPVWVIHNDKLYFGWETERIDENTHKKYYHVVYWHYHNMSDNTALLIETSSWSKRIAYIKMNLMLIKRFDISLKKGYII